MIRTITSQDIRQELQLLAMLVAAKYAWDRFQPGGPAVFKDPVYAELHVNVEVQGRTIEQVVFVQAASFGECEKHRAQLEQLFGQVSLPMTVKSAECLPELQPRQRALFEDQPGNVTYLSMHRGARTERDIRVIFWGVSVAESNQLCDGMTKAYADKHVGRVACVRALEA